MATGTSAAPAQWIRGWKTARPIGFVLLSCVLLGGMHAWREWSTYNAVLSDAMTKTSNLARSLAQHADDTFGTVDVALATTVERLESSDLQFAPERIENVARAIVQSVPPIRTVTVLGPDGRVVASSLGLDFRRFDYTGREYFQHHRDSPDRNAYLGPPIKGARDNEPMLTLSRRIEHPDRSFAGVVVATVHATYFATHYSRFDLGPRGAVTMFRDDGLFLARQPYDSALVGGKAGVAGPFRTQIARLPAGNAVYASPVDGVLRLSGFRRGARFPTIVLVAMSKEDVLAQWIDQATWRTVAVAALITLLLAMGWRVEEQDRRRRNAESALQLSETKFRMLAESSSDMLCRIGRDGVCRYTSPSSVRVVGFEPGELIGRNLLEMMHPDDRPDIETSLADLRAGVTDYAVLTYRTRHKDGHEVWIESSVRIAADPELGSDTAIAVSRDITERKRLENRLAALARQDGLTGIANRRAFDEALLAEWRRASRSRAPLSLVLLDIDRFKAFNDTQGHQEGDTCLRVVAQTVAGIAGRSGDLAVRYGGEEFAMLLPSTDEAGAASVAQRVRAAVEALAHPHADNQPFGVVTVSVGVATITLPPQGMAAVDASALVQLADGALYRAKARGRNQVVVAPPLFTLAPAPQQRASA